MWAQVLSPDKTGQLTIQGESPIYEFVAETVRKNIISFKNPLTPTDNVLYPFGWRFALDDVSPIFGLYFLFLRPFLNIHQSFILLIIGGVIISCLSMYLLLNILKINRFISTLVALVFGFTPFVNVRISAHPTYVALYLFTIPTIFFLKLLGSKSAGKRNLFAVLLGLSFALAFYTNLYFAIMLILLSFIFIIFYFFYNSKHLLLIFKKNLKYFLLSIFSLFIFLLPLIKEGYYIFYFGRADKPSDWKDMIAYSADLTNFFIPHAGNPIYKNFVDLLARNLKYISVIFENFIYPGLIIILSTFIFIFINKKLPKFLLPIFYTALAFLTLTLGPFLHVFGKNLNIPLPYALIAYTPIIQMARAPGRFIAPFIFLMSIITAFLLQYYFLRYRKIKYYLIGVAILVFLFDQYIFITPAPKLTYPNKIYKYLSNNPNPGPLLEIPFSIRDSIKNLGYANVIWSSYTQLIHNKPIFGAYAGRIQNGIFSYYTKNPLIGSVGKIVDPTTNPNSYQTLINQYDKKDIRNVIDFYKIKHVLLKQDEQHSTFISNLLTDIGFNKIKSEGQYSLWNTKLSNTYLSAIEFDSTFDDLMLVSGWGKKEDGQKRRWIIGKTARVFMNLKVNNYKDLIIEAESIVKTQKVKVYINRHYAGKIYFENGKKTTQKISVGRFLNSGLNTIILKTKYAYKLSEYIPESKDNRHLSLFVSLISLK